MTTGELVTAARPALMSGGRPHAIVPQSMDEAYRLGKAICLAGMAPKGMDSPEKCMIAIMRGMEVGLTPMQALDKIAIVNGRPTIWGDGALGLVRGSGVCEWVDEQLEGSGDARTATCRVQRRGEPNPIVRTFSVADAKTAKLWGKRGSNGQDTPWITMPDRMLRMRARAFALRDGFADVLGGLYLKEELDNDGDDRPTRRAPTPTAVEIAPSAAAPMIEHRQEAPHPRRAPAPPMVSKATEPAKANVVHAFAERAKAAQSHEELGVAWNEVVEAAYDAMPLDQQDECERINRHRQAELPGEGDDGGEANEP